MEALNENRVPTMGLDNQTPARWHHFMTDKDGTRVVTFTLLSADGLDVRFEQAVPDGFHSGICHYPGYRWSELYRVSDKELAEWDSIVKRNIDIIYDVAREGGTDALVD